MMRPPERAVRRERIRRSAIASKMFVNSKIVTRAIVKAKLVVRTMTQIAPRSNAMSPQNRILIFLPNPSRIVPRASAGGVAVACIVGKSPHARHGITADGLGSCSPTHGCAMDGAPVVVVSEAGGKCGFPPRRASIRLTTPGLKTTPGAPFFTPATKTCRWGPRFAQNDTD